ncbi:unnamed protein product, partial [Heterosigma akashiwo]
MQLKRPNIVVRSFAAAALYIPAPLFCDDAAGGRTSMEIIDHDDDDLDQGLTREQAQLLNASYEGSLFEVREAVLFLGAASLNVKDPMDGAGPLHLACAGGHLEIVQYFVEQMNANIHQVTNDGATPLCLAVSDGHLHITRYLVDLGADPSHCLSDGATPLILACIQGHLEIVQYLISECEVDARAATRIGESPLFLAGQEGHLAIAAYLIDAGGADVNQARNDGIAPLNNACWAGHLGVARLLLRRGARADARDFNGQTALHVCAE